MSRRDERVKLQSSNGIGGNQIPPVLSGNDNSNDPVPVGKSSIDDEAGQSGRARLHEPPPSAFREGHMGGQRGSYTGDPGTSAPAGNSGNSVPSGTIEGQRPSAPKSPYLRDAIPPADQSAAPGNTGQMHNVYFDNQTPMGPSRQPPVFLRRHSQTYQNNATQYGSSAGEFSGTLPLNCTQPGLTMSRLEDDHSRRTSRRRSHRSSRPYPRSRSRRGVEREEPVFDRYAEKPVFDRYAEEPVFDRYAEEAFAPAQYGTSSRNRNNYTNPAPIAQLSHFLHSRSWKESHEKGSPQDRRFISESLKMPFAPRLWTFGGADLFYPTDKTGREFHVNLSSLQRVNLHILQKEVLDVIASIGRQGLEAHGNAIRIALEHYGMSLWRIC
jgi:hypothetical protein